MKVRVIMQKKTDGSCSLSQLGEESSEESIPMCHHSSGGSNSTNSPKYAFYVNSGRCSYLLRAAGITIYKKTKLPNNEDEFLFLSTREDNGKISDLGGVVEQCDSNIFSTAVREFNEEIDDKMRIDEKKFMEYILKKKSQICIRGNAPSTDQQRYTSRIDKEKKNNVTASEIPSHSGERLYVPPSKRRAALLSPSSDCSSPSDIKCSFEFLYQLNENSLAFLQPCNQKGEGGVKKELDDDINNNNNNNNINLPMPCLGCLHIEKIRRGIIPPHTCNNSMPHKGDKIIYYSAYIYLCIFVEYNEARENFLEEGGASPPIFDSTINVVTKRGEKCSSSDVFWVRSRSAEAKNGQFRHRGKECFRRFMKRLYPKPEVSDQDREIIQYLYNSSYNGFS